MATRVRRRSKRYLGWLGMLLLFLCEFTRVFANFSPFFFNACGVENSYLSTALKKRILTNGKCVTKFVYGVVENNVQKGKCVTPTHSTYFLKFARASVRHWFVNLLAPRSIITRKKSQRPTRRRSEGKRISLRGPRSFTPLPFPHMLSGDLLIV